MNLKIRDAQLQKIPYMLVIGDREAQERHGLGAQSQARLTWAQNQSCGFHRGHSPLIDSKASCRVADVLATARLVAGSLVYCVLVIVAARRYLACAAGALRESSTQRPEPLAGSTMGWNPTYGHSSNKLLRNLNCSLP